MGFLANLRNHGVAVRPLPSARRRLSLNSSFTPRRQGPTQPETNGPNNVRTTTRSKQRAPRRLSASFPFPIKSDYDGTHNTRTTTRPRQRAPRRLSASLPFPATRPSVRPSLARQASARISKSLRDILDSVLPNKQAKRRVRFQPEEDNQVYQSAGLAWQDEDEEANEGVAMEEESTESDNNDVFWYTNDEINTFRAKTYAWSRQIMASRATVNAWKQLLSRAYNAYCHQRCPTMDSSQHDCSPHQVQKQQHFAMDASLVGMDKYSFPEIKQDRWQRRAQMVAEVQMWQSSGLLQSQSELAQRIRKTCREFSEPSRLFAAYTGTLVQAPSIIKDTHHCPLACEL